MSVGVMNYQDPLKSERSRLTRLSKSSLGLINPKSRIDEINKEFSIKSKVPAANLLTHRERVIEMDYTKPYDSARSSTGFRS